MALMTRFSRLMKADVNAMLDRIEEPDVVLRQAVRDMQEEHHAQARRIDRLASTIKQQVGRIQQMDQALSTIDPQLDDCFAAQREDLARELIQRRLELTQSISVYKDRLESMQTEHNRLQEKQVNNEVQLQSMRQKLELLTDDADACSTSGMRDDGLTVTQTDVDIAFVQEKQRRSQS